MPGPPHVVFSSPKPSTMIKTTADKAGEMMKALYKVEIKVTEAVSISKMFDDMMRHQVGTKDLEKTARVMAQQDSNKRGKTTRTLGGDGSSQLLLQSKVKAGAVKDNMRTTDYSRDDQVTSEGPSKNCTREPAIVVGLTKIKAEQARTMARDLRCDIWRLKTILKGQMTKKMYLETLTKVAKARTRAWTTAQRRHQKEIRFLDNKYKDCCPAHSDQIKAARMGMKISKSQVTDPASKTSSDNHNNWVDPLVIGTTITDQD